MNDETGTSDRGDFERLIAGVESIKRHLRRLIVSVSLMVLMLIVTVSAVFGNLVNFFGGDSLMWGGATAGAAILGFVMGWLARRKV